MTLAILIYSYKLNGCACEWGKDKFITSAHGVNLDLLLVHGQAARPQTRQCCRGCKTVGRISRHSGGNQQQVMREGVCDLLRCHRLWAFTSCSQPEAQCSQHQNARQAEGIDCEGQAAISISWPTHHKSGNVGHGSEVRASRVKTTKISGENKLSLISCSSIHVIASLLCAQQGWAQF